MKEKKGFTLVELLAVIIVLAIIMLIAVNNVIPLMTQAREGAFASTANNVLNAAETAVLADEINQNNYDCYSIQYLVSQEYVRKIKYDVTNGFSGHVRARRVVTGGVTSYEYDIHLADHKNGYYLLVNNVDGAITATNIVKSEPDTFSGVCPSGSTPAQ